MAWIMTLLTPFIQHFRAFFFRQEVPYGLALTRICLSAATLINMGVRWPRAVELYSADGAATPIAINYGYSGMLPLLSGPWTMLLFSVMMFLLFALMVGWKTRLAAWGVFFLYTFFCLQDSLSTLTKYTVISSHVFLLLALSECGAVWSVDRYREWKRLGLSRSLRWLAEGRAVDIWPQRLVQLMIAIVYFGAAITKLQTPSYFSGEQMHYWLLTNVNNWNPVGEWLSQYPFLLVPMCYLTIVWEITFLFMVWRPGFRVPFLLIGTVFHLLTTLTLGLYAFPLVCMSIYLAFIKPEDIAWWRALRARRACQRPVPVRRRSGWVSRWTGQLWPQLSRSGSLGFATCLLLLAGLGMLTHYTRELQASHPEHRPVLEPLPRERVQELFRGDREIAEEDMLFSLAIGKHLVSDRVLWNQNRFSPGDRIYIQVNVVPPHGDMLLECRLANSQGIVLDQTDGVLTRDNHKYTFQYFLLDTMEPGEYVFSFRFNNREVARRTIHLR